MTNQNSEFTNKEIIFKSLNDLSFESIIPDTSIQNNIDKPNLLLNKLKEFSNNSINSNTFQNKKFLLTFEEIISLLQYTLETQNKINEINDNETEILKKLSEDFIHNISNDIIIFESMEELNIIKNKSITTCVTKNTFLTTKKNPKIFNNNFRPKSPKNLTKNNSAQNIIQTSKSYYKTYIKKNKILTQTKSRINLNKSMQKRSTKNILDVDNSNNYESIKIKLNHSMQRRKTKKIINEKEEDASIIYGKTSRNSFISKKKNKINSNNKYNKENINSMNLGKNNVNKDKKENGIIYYDKSLNFGIKKRILGSGTYKPSTIANKLLLKGRQFINDFNGLSEHDKKENVFNRKKY